MNKHNWITDNGYKLASMKMERVLNSSYYGPSNSESIAAQFHFVKETSAQPKLVVASLAVDLNSMICTHFDITLSLSEKTCGHSMIIIEKSCMKILNNMTRLLSLP